MRKQPVAAEPVDAGRIAAEVLEFTRVRLRHARVASTLDCPGSLPPVTADPVQLYQAVLNLVLNAIEAMEDNPARAARTLRIALRAERDGVRLSVTDSGHGADDAALKRMAQTFHTTKDRGTGLGLLVTRSLVEAHGGRLDVARNRGRGLTFTIHLPGAEPP